MEKKIEFSFGDDSIAKSYDSILVPAIFKPWATRLIDDNQPWEGKVVLDLACGTGVVTKELASSVKSNGKIIALDMNSQMLDIARLKCVDWEDHIDFIEGSCESIEIADNCVDILVCQQGFQFFPNKLLAAREMDRVLKPGGKVIIATWCPVSECQIFGVICDTLESLDETGLSQMMRVPFDYLTQDQLQAPFSEVGFTDIEITKQQMPLYLNKEINSALMIAYATPIAPSLKGLSDDKRKEFNDTFIANMKLIDPDQSHCGLMVTNLLLATKQ